MMKKLSDRVKIGFESKPFNSDEFMDYYEIVAYKNLSGKARQYMEIIENYFDKYNPGCEYVDECYESCPPDVQKEITDLVSEIILAYMEYLLYNDSYMNEIIFD